MIRKFMSVTFPKVLDALFILSVVSVLVMAISAASMASLAYQSGSVAFIATFIPGLIGVIVGFGFIYILLDIRDALQRKQ